MEEEENLSKEESEEDEEKEGGSEAEQAPQQGSSVLSAEKLGQCLHQEGEALGWERCLR